LINIVKTNGSHPDFVQLVAELDAYLTITDGDEHDFYHQYNSIDGLEYVLLAFENDIPVACGAIKEYDTQTMEVKRMYVVPKARRKGIAKQLLQQLEAWAKALGYRKCILETGKRQVEAVQFYHQCAYTQIPNYGQYKNIANSICFEKVL